MIVRLLGKGRFQSLSGAFMDLFATLDQQGVIRDLLSQRVLEHVLETASRRLFVDELTCLQFGQYPFQLRLIGGGNLPDKAKRRLAADYRERLQEHFVLTRLSIDARGEHA